MPSVLSADGLLIFYQRAVGKPRDVRSLRKKHRSSTIRLSFDLHGVARTYSNEASRSQDAPQRKARARLRLFLRKYCLKREEVGAGH